MERSLLAVIVTLALFASVYASTNCEEYRDANRGSNRGHGNFRWNYTCNAQGEYDPPLQCTAHADNEKWCSCHSPDQKVSGPSQKLRHCRCAIARHEAREANKNVQQGQTGHHVPECQRNGKFMGRQCTDTLRSNCYCVNPDTNEKTTEPANNPALQCPNK